MPHGLRDRLGLLWRAARHRRGLRRAVLALDRLRWLRAIRAADLVDLDYVAAQLGARVTANEAVRHYVRGGFQTGFRLNPLFVDVAVGDHLPGVNEVPALYAYLVNDPIGVAVSPLWDAAAYLSQHPQRSREPGGAVGAVWRRRATEDVPLSAAPDAAWPRIHSEMIRACDAVYRNTALDLGRATDATASLVAVLGVDEVDFDETIADIAAFADDGSIAIVVVTDIHPETAAQAALLALTRPGVRTLIRPGLSDADAIRAGLAETSTGIVVVRGANTALDAATTTALVAEVTQTHSAAAPVWLNVDGTVAAAGGNRFSRYLSGHPAEDATGLAGPMRVTTLPGPVFAAARDVALSMTDVSASRDHEDLGGMLIPHLTARARSAVPVDPLSETAASAAFMTEAGWTPTTSGPPPRWRRPPSLVTLDDGTRAPSLRWALRTAAPAGPRGEWWGDTHFARGLADALRRLGQEVVIDAYDARFRNTAHLDDVTIVLRGPEPIDPPESGLSVLWVISHPEQQTVQSLASFDLVFAASESWSAAASSWSGVPVTPLLQCTDTTRFRPAGRPRGEELLFVGTARGIPRPSVIEPIRAGVPVRVYGPDWRGWIPAPAIAGLGVPNADLPALYETAAAVLNDHWPAMRDGGFIANRPFDVVAAGGRVVSDHVDGVDELFEGAVVTYRSIEELVALVRGNLDAHFPDETELAAIAHRIRAAHSFDARARTLLDAVLDRR